MKAVDKELWDRIVADPNPKPLRPARTLAEAEQRRKMVDQFRAARQEIEQIFIDCAVWNDNSTARANGAEPIDPDPDGMLKTLANWYDAVLRLETN